jgi:AraC-like DNA-binding protein
MTSYFEISPCNFLEKFVECFWVMKKDKSTSTWRDIIVPNGCSEIIIPSGSGYLRRNPKNGISEPINNAVLLGPRTGYHLLEEIQDGTTDIGVRFKANGLYSFFKDISCITDQIISIEHLFGKTAKKLVHQISKTENPLDKIKLLESYLVSLQPKRTNSIVENSIFQIHQSKGTIKIYDLINSMKIAKSTLERNFSQNTGLGPKSFINICRVNYSINYYLKHPSISLTQLAYQFNYSDQSHFIKVFKKHTGNTPSTYFSKQLPLLKVLSEEMKTRKHIYEV